MFYYYFINFSVYFLTELSFLRNDKLISVMVSWKNNDGVGKLKNFFIMKFETSKLGTVIVIIYVPEYYTRNTMSDDTSSTEGL